VEGHHLSWLRYIVGDLVRAGFRLTVTIDGRSESRRLVEQELAAWKDRVGWCFATDDSGKLKARSHIKTAEACRKESGASRVFFPNLDEVASKMMRRAALGWRPPLPWKGRLAGVYMRPRFLAPEGRDAMWRWKAAGFEKLTAEGWWHRLFFLDERVLEAAQHRFPEAPFSLLPDTSEGNYLKDQGEARRRLGLPEDRHIYLFFGGPYKRKGLPVAEEAWRGWEKGSRPFLLCAGRVPEDKAMEIRLAALEREGDAMVINRFVFQEEMEWCFAASDAVLLPYRKHFGSSGVLVQAAMAGRPVIASDEGLTANRVRRFNMGWLFRPGDGASLQSVLEGLESGGLEESAGTRRAGLERYALEFSPEAFDRALTKGLSEAGTGLDHG
jgi:glycosyltransferase involved in cell wall biosynthesis